MSEQPKYGIGSKAWCAGFLRGMVPDYPDSRGLTILQRSARAFELCRFDGMNRHLNDDQLVEVAIVLANDPNEKMASITAVLELGPRVARNANKRRQ